MRTTPSVVVSLLLVVSLVACGGDGAAPGDASAPDAAADAAPDAAVDASVDALADAVTPPGDAAGDVPAPPEDGGVDTVAAGPALSLADDGGYALRLTWPESGSAPALALLAPDGVTVLAASHADAPLLEVGTVPTFGETFFYDPFQADLTRQPPGLAWTPLAIAAAAATEADGGWTLPVAGEGVTGTLRLEVEATGTWLADLSVDAGERSVVFVRLTLAAPEGEQYYGLGEYFDQVAHRGKQRAMHIEVDGTQESGYNEAHVPIPLLVGTRGWGLFVEDRHPGAFDVAKSDPTRLRVTFHQRSGLRFRFFAAARPLDVPGLYTRVTGAPAIPPRWAFAVLQWRDEANNGAADVLEDAEAMRAVGYPAGAIWVDRPWQTAHSTFTFRPDRFPDVPGMVGRLHELGYRLAVWTSPYLHPDVQPQYDDALANGWFVPLPDWWPTPFDSRMMDLTQPDAKVLWASLVQNGVDVGIEGFKLDYGEDIQVGVAGARIPVYFVNGESEQTMHHWYHQYYHAPYAEALGGQGFLLSRAGTYGDQTLTTTVWPGDLCTNFKFHGEADDDPAERPHVGGLPAAILGGLSLSVSGYPWYASDTGGYRHERPTKELLVRWHEYSAILPIMQMGGGSNHRPWDFALGGDGIQYDQETLDLSAKYARLHLRLFPYFYAYSLAAHAHGWPVVRPFGMAFPEDGRHPNWTFLVGDWLLAAPVYRGDQTERDVPLPEGRWIDWWDGTAYEGPDDVTVPAPLGRLPLFLRAGAIVPMLRPGVETLSPATADGVDSYDNDPGSLRVRVVPDGVSAFTLHDGSVLEVVEQGAADGGGLALHVQDAGTFGGYLFEVDWRNRGNGQAPGGDRAPLAVRSTEDPIAEVALPVDGIQPGCRCWAWDAARGVLWVDVAPAADVRVYVD